MKTMYIECNMGVAGDMLTGALLELVGEKERFVEQMNTLGIPGVVVSQEPATKCGIVGTHIRVHVNGEEEMSEDHHHEHTHEMEHHHHHDESEHTHHHEEHHEHHHHDESEHTHHHEEHHEHHHHAHHSMHDIEHIVSHLNTTEEIKKDILGVYQIIASAESQVHGMSVTEIHFHEVGTMDALADIAGTCILMHELNVEQVVVSPIHVGSGTVKCAHGILPVPAPATANILKGLPIYGGSVQGELCTPTGAALLKYFGNSFGNMPIMQVDAIGYGMGTKDFGMANCVRVLIGTTETQNEKVVELNCNIDDMTGEEMGFALEQIFASGAFEAFTVPVQMKKNRPGILLYVLCSMDTKKKVVETIFQYTTTIGMRETVCDRYILDRSITTKDTVYGPIRCKNVSGYGVTRFKYEYEDLAKIAKENQISISEVLKKI